MAVPIALYRNRTRSVADRAVPGRHGDAAFADYVVFLGYWPPLLTGSTEWPREGLRRLSRVCDPACDLLF